MKPLLLFALLFGACAPGAHCDSPEAQALRTKLNAIAMNEKVNLPDAEWKKLLSPDQYRVLRESGTEPPFRNQYWNNHDKGLYSCAACGNALFNSETKFDSGTGWPSFFKPVRNEAVEVVSDTSHGMVRDEVRCARCGSHLGHVFNDGPAPTGQRYCMNSLSLKFAKKP